LICIKSRPGLRVLIWLKARAQRAGHLRSWRTAMRLAQHIGGHWGQLRRRIWPMRACCAKPDRGHSVEDENLRGATPAPRGIVDPRVIEAFMSMRCC
jgi:hypothetical protein